MYRSDPFTNVPRNINPVGNDFSQQEKVTLPQQKTYIVSRNITVDSRQRDYKTYPSPSYYTVELGNIYKNITSIELKGIILPKTSYNVHSTNNKIDFSIGSSLTRINIIDRGTGYTNVPLIKISAPLLGGIQATAHAILNGTGSISEIIIDNPGSGYTYSNPPTIEISAPSFQGNTNPNGITVNSILAKAIAIVGIQYTAELRPGQYTIGGNPTLPSDIPSGLVLEVQNAMNYAVNGVYNDTSVSPFTVRLVSQYPTLNAVAGTPEAFGTNACPYNRIQITNVNNDHWELLFATGHNNKSSVVNLLGFMATNLYQPTVTTDIPNVGPILIPGGTTYRGSYDYDLLGDPNYVILKILTGGVNLDRTNSDDQGLNRKFATILFDANVTDNLKDLSGNFITDADINYLNGPVTKGSFYFPPGTLKSLKGADFDQKKIVMSPAEGKIASLTIMFTKFGTRPGGEPEFYDFQGRNHMFIFEVTADDQQSGMRS